MISIVHDFPALITRHPRLPGVELYRGPRTGGFYLLAVGVPMSGEELVDAGEWLAERGREHTEAPER